MVSEIGDYFNDLREHNRDKKLHNKESSTEMLESLEIPFSSHNFGTHLVVTHPHNRKIKVDFWPSTGKFIFRDTGKKGRGVFNLLKRLGINLEFASQSVAKDDKSK